MVEERFLTGSTMGSGAHGGDQRLWHQIPVSGGCGQPVVDFAPGPTASVTAIGFAYAIQFFSVSSGIWLMIAATALSATSTLRAEGFGAKAMYVTPISGLVPMELDPIFITWWGLGLDGAALDLVLFRFCHMGLELVFAAYQPDLIARPDIAAVNDTARADMAIALPAIGTQMASPTGNYCQTIVMMHRV